MGESNDQRARWSGSALPSLGSACAMNSTKILPQQTAALREAGRTIIVPPGPKPKVFKSTARPIPTAAPGPKLHDDGLYFPRGDVGAQQFGYRSKAVGEQWLNAPRSQPFIELTTNANHGLRAYKIMG